MRRRGFLTGLGVAAVAPRTLFADIACFPGPFPGQRTCEIGVPLGPMPTPWQNCQYWCWAACAQAAFMIAGYNVSQEMFAAKAFGNPNVCRTATGPVIKQAVDGEWTDLSGRVFSARLDVILDYDSGLSHPAPLAVAWEELRASRPIMVGSLSHATLMTALNYTESPSYPPQINFAVVRDPWPYNPNRRAMSLDEFVGVRFLAKFSFG